MERYPGMNFEIIRFTTPCVLEVSNPDILAEELEGE